MSIFVEYKVPPLITPVIAIEPEFVLEVEPEVEPDVVPDVEPDVEPDPDFANLPEFLVKIIADGAVVFP
jgi:hypothetical protein